MPRKLTKSEFVYKSILIHGEKYNYSKFEYKNAHTKGIITCTQHTPHHEFLQNPSNHLSKKGCPKCMAQNSSTRLTSNKKEFITKAQLVHGIGRYDYSEYNYINSKTISIIICYNHEAPYKWKQSANNHLTGCGCWSCSYVKRAKDKTRTFKEFIKEAKLVHFDEYCYDLVTYISCHQNIIIIHNKCKKQFEQTPNNHLRGQGCRYCNCTKQISKPETAWLDSLSIPLENRQKVLRINNKRYNVDAFDPVTNTVYEFYGSYYHGNPKYFDQNKMNTKLNKTYGALYERTLQREKDLRFAGYNVISIWEEI